MTLRHLNIAVDESTQDHLPEKTEEQAAKTCTSHVQMRPELRKLFEARWKRNEPGYRFLADR